MNYNKNLLFTLCVAFMLYVCSACDVVEEPYSQNVVPSVIDSTNPKILLEDFTAHKCLNCPKGAEVYHNLQNQYPGKIIVVSIHGGIQAYPDEDNYTNNFMTSEGTRLIRDYNAEAIGMPCALVSRRNYNGKQAMERTQWAGAISDYWAANTNTPLRIALSASADTNARTISANVKLNYLLPSSTQNLLSVWIVEDSIVGYQKSADPPYDIPDYVHNNVFRASFNGAYGELVSTAKTIPVGFEYNKDFNFTIPSDKHWNYNNLRVVAFVYDNSEGIVKQAEESKIIISN